MTTDFDFASELGVETKQADIRAAKEAIAGPVPLIAEAPDPMVKLPRGLFHSGIWEREVTCRELTGVDEEQLAKAATPYAYFNTVLAQGVTSIGSFDLSKLPLAERQFYLNDLLLGEREQIFLKIVQVSFGNQREIGFTCNACGEKQDVTLLLDTDFPPAKVDNVDATTLEFVTSRGDTLTYRAALGSDQEAVMDHKGLTAAEQNTLMLERCITKRNGELIPDPHGFARSLPMRDRLNLLQELVARQPQISLDISTACASCGARQTLGMGWGDFFRS